MGPVQLCSATFEPLLAFGATFCSSNNLGQFLPIWAIFLATFWFKADAKHDKINDFTKSFNLCKFVEWLAGLPSYIRADNRLKRRAKMAVFVYVLSMNGNGWLEATFLYEQHLKAKFISEERKT